MRKIAFISFFMILLSAHFLMAQQNKKQRNWNLNGYLKNMQTVWMHKFNDNWITSNTINNRLNFKWFPDDNLITNIGMRNRFIYGQMFQLFPNYKDIIDVDNGYFNLTKVIADGNSYVLLSDFDRANIDYSKGNWDIKIGRQRVNWGIGFIWNPNDIFNTFSYFDFDYEERPGSDALKVEYYTSSTSSTQFVYSMDNNKKITFAGMHSFNRWDYDIQFLAGIMKNDLVIGGGWTGQIEGGGFRGEMTYFLPKDNIKDSSGVFVASVEGDYTFKNSLYVHTAFLFNSNGTTGNAGRDSVFLDQNITAKNLTRAKYSIFGQLSYLITPLIKSDISSIYNPDDKSVFVGPSVDISLKDDLYLMLISQMFFGNKNTEFGDYGKLFFVRFKYNF